MIDLTIDPKGLENAVAVARQRKIVIPTFRQMRDPGYVPFSIVRKLAKVSLSDIDPLNLFRPCPVVLVTELTRGRER